MAEQIHTDAPPSCPTFEKLSKKEQETLFDAFEQAIELVEKAGLSEAEIFQFFEDVIDVRASEQVLDEMERTGEKPMPLEEFEKELDAQ
jgi:hypothetical protein